MEMKLRELFELIGNDYISYNYLNGLVYEDMPNTLLNTYELISHRPFKLKGELANYKKKMDKFTDGSFSCDGVGVLVYYENLITKQWFIDEYQDMEDVKRFIINSLYDTSINHEFTTIIKSSKKVRYNVYYDARLWKHMENETVYYEGPFIDDLSEGVYKNIAHNTYHFAEAMGYPIDNLKFVEDIQPKYTWPYIENEQKEYQGIKSCNKIRLRNLLAIIASEYENVSQTKPYINIYEKLLYGYNIHSKYPVFIEGDLNCFNKDDCSLNNQVLTYSGFLVYYENMKTKQWWIREFEAKEDVKHFILDSFLNFSIHQPYVLIFEKNELLAHEIIYTVPEEERNVKSCSDCETVFTIFNNEKFRLNYKGMETDDAYVLEYLDNRFETVINDFPKRCLHVEICNTLGDVDNYESK